MNKIQENCSTINTAIAIIKFLSKKLIIYLEDAVSENL